MANIMSNQGRLMRLACLAFFLIAFFSTGARAASRQEPLHEPNLLKPKTFTVNRVIKSSQIAEQADVDVSIRSSGISGDISGEIAEANLLTRRDEIENLIQSYSKNTTVVNRREEVSVWSGRKASRRGRYMDLETSAAESESIDFSTTLSLEFKDLDALRRFAEAILRTNDVEIDMIDWKLTSESEAMARRVLRKQALKDLRDLGTEYAEDFEMTLARMENYTEQDGEVYWSDDQSIYGWDSIKAFYAEDDESFAMTGVKAGNVVTQLSVSCTFHTE